MLRGIARDSNIRWHNMRGWTWGGILDSHLLCGPLLVIFFDHDLLRLRLTLRPGVRLLRLRDRDGFGMRSMNLDFYRRLGFGEMVGMVGFVRFSTLRLGIRLLRLAINAADQDFLILRVAIIIRVTAGW